MACTIRALGLWQTKEAEGLMEKFMTAAILCSMVMMTVHSNRRVFPEVLSSRSTERRISCAMIGSWFASTDASKASKMFYHKISKASVPTVRAPVVSTAC